MPECWARSDGGQTLFHPHDSANRQFCIVGAEKFAPNTLFERRLGLQVHRDGAQLKDLRRENDLKLTLDEEQNRPDFCFRLLFSSRAFNFLVELDLGSEPEFSHTECETIEKKVQFHVRYQDHLLTKWLQRKESGAPAPRYRPLLFTAVPARTRYILSLARALAVDPNRKLCYAVSIDEYLSRSDALRAPVFLNHQGRWASLTDLHPTPPGGANRRGCPNSGTMCFRE